MSYNNRLPSTIPKDAIDDHDTQWDSSMPIAAAKKPKGTFCYCRPLQFIFCHCKPTHYLPIIHLDQIQIWNVPKIESHY